MITTNSKIKSKVKIIAILGLLAVILGAFGSHGLKPKLAASSYSAYQTGIQYHFYHILAALATVLLSSTLSERWLHRSFYSFIIGTVLFSGSLYLLAIKDIVGIPLLKIAGPITPLGGLFLIIGWSFLLKACYSGTNENLPVK